MEQGKVYSSRYGDRAGEPLAAGHPVKPDHLSVLASDHWNAVVPELVAMGVAKGVDAHALAAMCEQWALWRSVENTPTQRGQALDRWLKIGGKFGMTPSDRAGLDVRPKSKASKLTDLLA